MSIKITFVVVKGVIFFSIILNMLSLSSSKSGLVSQLNEDDDFIIDLFEFGSAPFGKLDCRQKSSDRRALHHNANVSSESWNPEELGTYFQGDILFPTAPKSGLRATARLWPRALVPYVIEGDFQPDELLTIRNAFKEYHARTCVRFQKRSKEKDFVSLQNLPCGCFSSVGRVGGKQVINLQSNRCVRHGTVLHELMHTVGFLHEHSRHDRDRYVRVMWNNVKPKHKLDFKKSNSTYSSSFGVKYSYASIMHYSPGAFSVNGWPTLVPLEKNGSIETGMGQRKKFSEADIRKINLMYKCK